MTRREAIIERVGKLPAKQIDLLLLFAEKFESLETEQRELVKEYISKLEAQQIEEAKKKKSPPKRKPQAE